MSRVRRRGALPGRGCQPAVASYTTCNTCNGQGHLHPRTYEPANGWYPLHWAAAAQQWAVAGPESGVGGPGRSSWRWLAVRACVGPRLQVCCAAAVALDCRQSALPNLHPTPRCLLSAGTRCAQARGERQHQRRQRLPQGRQGAWGRGRGRQLPHRRVPAAQASGPCTGPAAAAAPAALTIGSGWWVASAVVASVGLGGRPCGTPVTMCVRSYACSLSLLVGTHKPASTSTDTYISRQDGADACVRVIGMAAWTWA